MKNTNCKIVNTENACNCIYINTLLNKGIYSFICDVI